MKKKLQGLLMIATVLVASSCATFLRKDSDQSITLDPEPKGALVYVNGQYKGLSPVTLNLDPTKTYEVKYIHPHYLSESFTLQKGIIKKWLWMDLASLAVGNPTAIITDAITEKWKGFDASVAPTKLKHWSDIEDPADHLNEIFQLKNLYFETGSATIKSESKGNLDKLADFLKKFPNAKIEVRGHTDKTGGNDLNMKLSKDRANSVVEYLKGKGVNAANLKSNGFGSEKPLVEGDTEEAYKYNRRVEFKFVN